MSVNRVISRAALATWAFAVAGAAHAQPASSSPAQGASESPRQVDCRPVYPAAAVRAQVQGVTTLAFHVDATGKVTGVDIVRSSGPTREHRLLDHAAATALSRCPIKAATDDNGQPIDGVVTVNYTWRLQ